MKRRLHFLTGTMTLLAIVATAHAQTVVYDNLATAATAGYSELNSSSPIFGDALTLSMGGQLGVFGASLYNSTSGGNTGSILTGTMVVKFYDNTTAYTGGALNNPLLGSVTVPLDLTATGGLPAGFYVSQNFDLSAQNIILPENVFVTQQFTQTSGTSTRNGVVLYGNPSPGSSPNTVYLFSGLTAEGLYTFSGNPGQFGYHLEVVPEPSAFALIAGVLALGFGVLRRSRKA
jgi:hypothetical protein